MSGLERKFVAALCLGKSLGEAAISAGYSPKNPRQSGYQALEGIKSKMPEIMEKQGLTGDALIYKYLRPALDAMETEFAKFEGKITDSKDVIAWGPRLQALDLAFKLRGDYAAAKAELAGKDGEGIRVVVEHIGSTNTEALNPSFARRGGAKSV